MLLFPDPTTHPVGIDLADHAFRLVEIRRGPFSRRLQLRCYAEERLPDGLLVRGECKKPEEIVKHLKNLLRKAYGRYASRSAVVSLPETRTFIKVISVRMPEKASDLEREVLAEVELHIPTTVSDLYVDWQLLENGLKVPPGKPVTVIIGAVPKSVVDSYSQVLEAAGIVPVAFEIEAQAIVRSIIKSEAGTEAAIGIIDLGATRSSFIVYDRGMIQFTVSLPISGDDITRRISQALNVSLEEAERTKRQCGLDAHTCGADLWRIMQPFMEDISAHAVEAMRFYHDHFASGRPLEQLFVAGGGANMRLIDEQLTKLTGLKVSKADPWVHLYPARCPLPSEILLSSTTAMGLALRHSFEDIKKHRLHEPVRPPLAAAAKPEPAKV